MTSFDPVSLGDGLWKRLRDVIMVSERIDTFAFGPASSEEPRTSLSEEDASAVSVEFVLRALRVACDRTNFLILRESSGDDGADAGALATITGIPSLAVSERIADLLQSGLAVRQLDSNRVFATEAGRQVVALVEAVAERLATTAKRARGTTGSNHELPVL